MNKPVKVEHPDWMSETDIAIYDQMISMGRLQIGKEIGNNEEYLLHISAMITLKQLKGMIIDIDDDSIKEIKRIHQEHLDAGLIFETPQSDWYESARVLREPYLDKTVEQQINDINGITSNLVIEDKKTSNIADEQVDVIDELKEGYVKIVPRPEPEPVVVESPDV
jgi:hypothetical protein